MPNWCNNSLTVKGTPERVKAFDEAFIGHTADWGMPKYSSYWPSEMEEVHREQYEQGRETKKRCFNALYPVPQEVLDVGYSVQPGPDEDVETFVETLYDKEKWRDGYSWCVSHWGTKWDVDIWMHEQSPDVYMYAFETAWSPPAEWLMTVAKNWTDLKFTLLYEEMGACFAGLIVIVNGVVDEDNCVEGEDAYRDFVVDAFGYDPYEGLEDFE